MSGRHIPTEFVDSLCVLLAQLGTVAEQAEGAGCPALWVEASAARAMLEEAAEFDGVHP